MTKNASARTPALKKAQAKYGSTLRQFKFALSRERDMTLIALLENIPNLKNWAINHIRKENRMKIKVKHSITLGYPRAICWRGRQQRQKGRTNNQ